MRFSRAAVALTAAALLLSGCSASPQSADSPSSGGAAGGSFPATVDTTFGEITVEEKPQRIVALGWGDAETALALGSQPVGASDWLGFGGEGVGPWAEGLYDEAPEIIETLEPSYEAIAALQPDLILDVKSSGDAERYERLSSIATTIGVPEGGNSYLTNPKDQVRMIATALGVPEKGEELLAEVDDAFAAVVAEHPEWTDRTVVAATRTSEGWGAYIEGSGRVTFLENLGFRQSPDIAAIETNSGGFSVDISSEQLDLLDADLIVAFPIFLEKETITDDPLFQAVPAVADGRAVVIDGALSDAYSLGSTLSTLYAIDEIVPLIAAATA